MGSEMGSAAARMVRWMRRNAIGLAALVIACSGVAVAGVAEREASNGAGPDAASDRATASAKGKRGRRGPPGPAGPQGTPCLPSNPACVGPQGNPGQTGQTGPGAQFATATVAATQSVNAPMQDLGGPTVSNVAVGPSGVAEVMARVSITAVGNTITAYLFIDGVPVAEKLGCASMTGALLSTNSTQTRYTQEGNCDTGVQTGPLGTILVQTTPGVHTFSLRYGINSSAGSVSNRTLWVAGR